MAVQECFKHPFCCLVGDTEQRGGGGQADVRTTPQAEQPEGPGGVNAVGGDGEIAVADGETGPHRQIADDQFVQSGGGIR